MPRGNSEGGQWTREGGFADPGFPLLLVSGPPEIPENEPPTNRQRNPIAYAVARWIAEGSAHQQQVMAIHWLRAYAADRINAYLEPAKTLEELRAGALVPRRGYEIHHIVEQSSARDDGFPEERIHSPYNLVNIPTYRHWQINGWYSTPNEEFRWLTPRDYLRGQGWSARYALGLRALRDKGVLK